MSQSDADMGWVSESGQTQCMKATIADVATVQSGVGFPKSYQGKTEDKYPVYKVGDVSRSVLNTKGFLAIAGNSVSEMEAMSLKGTIFPEGTTLFAKIGEAVRLNRRAFVVKSGLADNNVMGVKPLLSEMDKFIYYFMRTVDLNEASRSTTVPSIRKSDIEDLVLNIPPLAEQQQIAARLDELLAQVDTLKTRLDTIPKILKRFRQSVLAAAVNGKLTEDWRGDIAYHDVEGISVPISWTVKQAQESCVKVQSGSTPRDNPFDQNGTIPFLKVYNIVDQKIDFNYKPQFITKEVHEKGSKRSIAYPNDVLMNIVGPPLGKIALLTDQYPEWNLNQAITFFRANDSQLNFQYLYYVLCEGALVRKVMPDTKGSVGQVNISLSQCREALITLPPIKEQSEIVRRVDQLFIYADQIEQRVKDAQARVNHLTQSILAKAFRGELTADWREQNPDLISGENSAEALLARIQTEQGARTLKKAKKQL